MTLPKAKKLICLECKQPFRPRGASHLLDCSIGQGYTVPPGIHSGYRFLVFGSRVHPPEKLTEMFDFLDGVLAKHPDLSLLHGGAQGVDFAAQSWADDRGVATEVWEPQYDLFGQTYRFGKGIAPLWRNAEMAHRYPNAGLGVVGPCTKETCRIKSLHGSHGSVDMAVRAHDLGIPVFPMVWGGLDQLAQHLLSAYPAEEAR